MDTGFRLFPEQASTVAGRVDSLYVFLVVVSLFFTALICCLILSFGVKYRRGSRAERSNPPGSIWLEVGWAVIPLVLTMVMFVWGASVYFQMRQMPVDALQINVVGKQWMWKLRHPSGRSEINELHIPVGRDIRLNMISEDVIHSFYIPNFRVKQDVLPGRYTAMWFRATRVGEYHLFCAEYCGTEHAQMNGRVIVQEPSAYSDWISGETHEAPTVTGKRLFERHRCDSCHRSGPGARGPTLEGILGMRVPLASGGTVVADEAYLRESILNPRAKIVAGYQPLMPTFEGQLSEEDVLDLIAYIASLSQDGAETRTPPQTEDGP